MSEKLGLRTLWIVAGAGAGALAGFAVLAAAVGRVDVSPLAATSIGGAVGAIVAALALGHVRTLTPRARQRVVRRAVGAAVVAAVFLLVARPFQLSQLRWTLAECSDAGVAPRPYTHVHQWGEARTQIFDLHASIQPADATQPWRHRIEADTRYLCALGDATVRVDATLPNWAAVDPATGTPRAGFDGVTCRLQARVGATWTTLASSDLEPTTDAWKSLSAELPRGTNGVAVSLDAHAAQDYETVFLAQFAPQARAPLGISLMPLLRLGEFLAAWLVLFVLGTLLERLLVGTSRWAFVPALSLGPEGAALPRAVRAMGLVALLVAPLGFAIPVAPWLEALVTPVLIRWDAPEGTPLEVRFGPEARDRVPAVRIDATTWRADLPPRPTYRLALELPASYDERAALPSDLRLIDPRSGLELATASVAEFRKLARSAEETTGAAAAPPEPTLRLVCEQEFTTAQLSLGARIFFLWLGGVIVLATLASLVLLVRRRATTDPRSRHHEFPSARPILLAGLVAMAIACACHFATPPRMTEDSFFYLCKGQALAERGTLDTGVDGLEAVRTPGYPGWLAIAIKLVGLDVDAITLTQVLLYVSALVFVALSLRGAVRTRWLVAGVLLGALSPTQQHFMRDLMSECVFVSLCLVTLGCHFFARSSSRGRAAWWLVASALATTGAMLTRVNAVALLAVPGVLWLSSAFALWRSRNTTTEAARGIARASVPLVAIASFAALTMLVWSYRNYKTCGYFGVSSMVKLSDMQGEIQTGMLDPRVLQPRGFYSDYVRTKMVRNGEWSSWFIQETLYQRAFESGVPERERIRHIEDEFGRMVAESNAALPPAARLVKFVRATWWNVQFAPSRYFLQSQVLEDFSEWGYVSAAEYAREMRDILHRDTGLPIVVREPRVGPFGEFLLGLRTWYAHVDCPLLLLGFAAACWMIARGRPSLAAPFCFVLANFALLSYLRQQEWRYMGVMDVFLMLQLVIALGYVAPTAEKRARPASR